MVLAPSRRAISKTIHFPNMLDLGAGMGLLERIGVCQWVFSLAEPLQSMPAPVRSTWFLPGKRLDSMAR
jgi:hypothetical protein